MKYFILFVLLSATIPIHAQSNLPPWFIRSFKQLKLNHKYELKGYLKPPYLEADFSGDGKTDIAILVDERKTKKKGVLIIQNGGNQYFVFGAGTKFGNRSDDLKWANNWKIYDSKTPHKRQALFIYDLKDQDPNSGWIIYWTGKQYIWIHQFTK